MFLVREMFFIFKCGCLGGSNNLNLHLEMTFLKKSRAWKNFKIFWPSVLTIVALHVTLKQVYFFHTVFHDATLDEAWTVPIVLPKKIENKRKKTGQILIW